ncbi:MAG: hypothetical protein ABI559_13425 [Chloroflexota bacterium]
MRIALLIAVSFALILTACSSDDDDLPTATTTAPTPTSAGAITFCPQIGNGSTPTTPTPIPSCAPNDNLNIDLSGVSLHEADSPPIPSGQSAASPYYTLAGPGVGFSASISITLLKDQLQGERLAFYTYTDTGWQRAGDVTILAPSETTDASAIGSFDRVPNNLIVLAETHQ